MIKVYFRMYKINQIECVLDILEDSNNNAQTENE